MKQSKILIHQDELDALGMDVQPASETGYAGDTPHRDDHYMFVLQEQGSFTWEVDFREICLSGSAVSFITPGQVHRYIEYENSRGWLVFVDASLIRNDQREILANYANVNPVAEIHVEHPVFKLVPMLLKLLQPDQVPLQQSLIAALIETMTVYVASRFIQLYAGTGPVSSQKYLTVSKFKHLVALRHVALKKVKDFAALLNISPLYLNEIVKEITGSPASFWISQQTLLEAKRMLYYTTLDVRQIAYELGYDDHQYFSRFFKKNTGITALAFRNQHLNSAH